MLVIVTFTSFREFLPGVAPFLAGAMLISVLFLDRTRLKPSALESEALARIPGDAWLMHVCVLREWTSVGTDRGLVRFEDHALVFEGERCSFCLGTQDVSDKRQLWSFRIPDGSLRDTGPPQWMVRLKGYAGGLEVAFTEIKVPADKRWFEIRKKTPKVEPEFNAFDHALEAFLGDKEPTSLPRVYPPVTP